MKLVRSAAWLLGALLLAQIAFGYSVLTHEEIVDLTWKSNLKPLILARFPNLTEDQLTEAHAYAYGGSVLQDLGYYPFGSKEFSDLVHYVRSGDFVLELLRQSKDANEYAFALGALGHYISDVDGHPAVNRAVAMGYPKLLARFGRSVTYSDDKVAHLKTEFGFDVSQVAKNRYAPQDYHNFIGFQVSEGLLERTFPVVYGLELKEVLPHEEMAVGSYRWAVAKLIPRMTKVALRMRGKEMAKDTPNFQRRKFLYRISRSEYERSWGHNYEQPGRGTRLLAALLNRMPMIGPLKGLDFKEPTKKTEDIYITSINKTVDDYQRLLAILKQGSPPLEDRDLDTGAETIQAEYVLADETYDKLVVQLANKKFIQTSPVLRENILNFYTGHPARPTTAKDKARHLKISAAIENLKNTVDIQPTVTSAIE